MISNQCSGNDNALSSQKIRFMFVSPTLRPRVHLQKLPKSIRYHSWEKQPTKIYHYRVGPTRFVVSRWLLSHLIRGYLELGTFCGCPRNENPTCKNSCIGGEGPPWLTHTHSHHLLTNSHDTLTLLVHFTRRRFIIIISSSLLSTIIGCLVSFKFSD